MPNCRRNMFATFGESSGSKSGFGEVERPEKVNVRIVEAGEVAPGDVLVRVGDFVGWKFTAFGRVDDGTVGVDCVFMPDEAPAGLIEGFREVGERSGEEVGVVNGVV